jgi:tetratricopeptide (TPR) repeat protein
MPTDLRIYWSMRGKAAPWILLLLASFFFWPNRDLADHAFADSPDYIYPALRFLQGHGFVQILNGITYPPAGHPVGLAMMLVPFYAVLGDHAGNGVYAVWLCAIATVWLTYRLAVRFYDIPAAVIACLLLMSASQFRYYSRIVSTDAASGAVLVLCVLVLALKARDSGSAWPCLWLGQLIGFSTIFRQDNLILVVAVVALLWKRWRSPHLFAAFAGSLLLWGGVHLACNRAYTGDWTRSITALYNSPQMDRVGGAMNWRYFGQPSLLHSSFAFVLRTSVTQWCYDGPIKAVYVGYACLNLFLVAGIMRARNELSRYFLILVLAFTMFYSCLSLVVNVRFFLRLVPMACILTGAGITAAWRGVRLPKIAAAAGLIWAGCLALPREYVCDPGVMPIDRLPFARFLQRVRPIVTEPNAVILTSFNLFEVDYYLGGPKRTLIPIHDEVDPLWWVQWKRPRHPEWINEDAPVPYRNLVYARSSINGGSRCAPSFLAHPELVDDALKLGRPVYYLSPSLSTYLDFRAVTLLTQRYSNAPFESGFGTMTYPFLSLRVYTRDYGEAHNKPGNAPLQAGTLEEAIARYEQALRVQPNDAEGQLNLGLMLMDQGKVPEAIAHYEQALRLNPDYADAHCNLGATLGQLGRIPEAIGHLEQALRLKPDLPEAHNNLGNALMQLGRPQEAMAHFQEAVRLKPDHAEAHYNLALAFGQVGRLDEAIHHYERAVQIKPDYPEAHYDLGVALAQTGKIEEAIAHFEQALRLEPDNAEAHNNLGGALARTGKIKEAIAHFEQALRIRPDYAGAHYNLGIALEQTGNVPEAIQHYKQAVQLKPGFVEAQNRLARLQPRQ